MQVKTQESAARLVIIMQGELDHHSAEPLRQSLDDIIKSSTRTDIVFDMSGITFMDSSGLGVILGRYKIISAKGSKLSIKGANRTIDKILRMSGVYTIIANNKQ